MGYWLGGWIFALAFVLLFLILLPPLNLLVLKLAPDDLNMIVAFQVAKWAQRAP